MAKSIKIAVCALFLAVPSALIAAQAAKTPEAVSKSAELGITAADGQLKDIAQQNGALNQIHLAMTNLWIAAAPPNREKDFALSSFDPAAQNYSALLTFFYFGIFHKTGQDCSGPSGQCTDTGWRVSKTESVVRTGSLATGKFEDTPPSEVKGDMRRWIIDAQHGGSYQGTVLSPSVAEYYESDFDTP